MSSASVSIYSFLLSAKLSTDTCAHFANLKKKEKKGYADLSRAYIKKAAPGRDTDIT